MRLFELALVTLPTSLAALAIAALAWFAVRTASSSIKCRLARHRRRG